MLPRALKAVGGEPEPGLLFRTENVQEKRKKLKKWKIFYKNAVFYVIFSNIFPLFPLFLQSGKQKKQKSGKIFEKITQNTAFV